MTAVWEALDAVGAPTAAIDLDQFDANAQALVDRSGGLPIRVASKSVRVRSLIERVLQRAEFQGVLGYSVAEAIFLSRNGIDDIIVAYPSVDTTSIHAVAADPKLAAAVTFMVDLPDHVRLLAQAAGDHPLRVALDIDCSLRLGPVSVGAHRSSIHTPRQASRMAALIADTGGVDLVGMMFYEAQVAGVPDNKTGIGMVKSLSNRQLDRQRGAVRAAVERHATLEFVNGGGTGSLHTTSLDPAITELAAGSGLFAPTSFDGFTDLGTGPAAFFGSPVTRKPARDIAVTFSGGYLASGVVDDSRRPTPVFPPGLHYLPQEGAGEVQSPLRGKAARSLSIGDTVWFRHAKAGEMCERFDEIVLVSRGQIVDRVPTYRGEGQNFG
ncbi:alanine racemase [Calidifontibacter terrae]